MQYQPQQGEDKELISFTLPVLRAKDPLSDIEKMEQPKASMIDESLSLLWAWIGELEMHANRLKKLRRKAIIEQKIAFTESASKKK